MTRGTRVREWESDAMPRGTRSRERESSQWATP